MDSGSEAFEELERSVRAALEVYSNVHRGTGHFSLASTTLFEEARGIVLDHLGLDPKRMAVVFCTPHRAAHLVASLHLMQYTMLSSREFGLPLGLRALAIPKAALLAKHHRPPFETGGGMVKLVSPDSVVWADVPERFEAGTPPILNAIAFARALQLGAEVGGSLFQARPEETRSADEILQQDTLLPYTGRELLRRLRETVVGHDGMVPTAEGERPYVNFDNGASTPTFAPVWDAVCAAWRQPEPVQRDLVRQVRELCTSFLDAPAGCYELLFTSNTTEALNLAARTVVNPFGEGTELVVLNTLLEHHSNELPWRYQPDLSLVRLPVDDPEGFVDPAALEARLREYNRDHRWGPKRIGWVTVCGASNVFGTFADLPAITEIAHRYGAYVLVDGAQWVAHRRFSMVESGVDGLAFSGHKVYAPFGSGALVIRKGLLHLDDDEAAALPASGEENVVGIAALGKALLLLQRIGMDVVAEEERELTGHLLRGLADIAGVQVYGIRDPAAPHMERRGGVIVFSVATVPHNLVARELAERGGIGVRNGCFCAHLIVKHLMHIHPWRSEAAEFGLWLLPKFTGTILPGVTRISLGAENDEDDVDRLLQVLHEIAQTPRSSADRLLASTPHGTLFLPHTAVEAQIRAFVRAASERVYT